MSTLRNRQSNSIQKFATKKVGPFEPTFNHFFYDNYFFLLLKRDVKSIKIGVATHNDE